MTQNDQAAMNGQLTELRLNGLSIDGDNRYKQDLIDAIIGAMMFGAQDANPPPAGHWLEQFYVIAREERQALARVEAERDAERARGDAAVGDANEAEAQLAEAVGLLKRANGDRSFSPKLERDVFSFLARHAQDEQQEAQGAQAGDDAIKLFERIISRSPADLDKATEDNPWYQVMASEVRAFAAALATQSAAIKLPERQPSDQKDDFKRGCAHGFNACLIAVSQLNAVRGAEHD